MTGKVHSCNELLVWVRISSGLNGRWTEGVEDNMLNSIAPRVIRISQNCQKGITECNTNLLFRNATSGPPSMASSLSSLHPFLHKLLPASVSALKAIRCKEIVPAGTCL